MTTSEASCIPPSQPSAAPGTARAAPSAPRPVAVVLEDVALLADDFAVEPAQAGFLLSRTRSSPPTHHARWKVADSRGLALCDRIRMGRGALR